ncbi:MAG: ribosome small subunit-dependent GTPase A [Erysipelotrichales bacterium]|nr:ribosome small subunit-dependent GTPase A [Erysipelotrichales bacterium]
MTGRIVSIISNLYTVDANDELYKCRARGKFREQKQTPLVGDIVEFDENKKYILKIMPRKNELSRPTIANVDKCVVVTSCKRPDFSSSLLDKMLTNIILSSVEPIIVFTKYDLLTKDEKEEFDNLIKYYNDIGIDTLINTNLAKLEKLISGATVTLTGQTGAGKSSIINKLNKDLNLKTDDISEALGRGKHTTRHVELYKVKDYYIADTPGFSALDVIDDKDNIRFAFYEFDNDGCKFRDCKHLNEIGCKVIDDVEAGIILKSRYSNYRDMVIK